MQHEVDFARTPASTAAVTRFHVGRDELATIGEQMGRAFGAVMAALGQADVHADGPALAYYEPTDDGFDVAAGFRVAADFTAPPGVERLDLGEVEAAHTTHIGPYSELTTAYDDLQRQAADAGRALVRSGPMWEEYWSPPETPDDQTRTEVYWPVASG